MPAFMGKRVPACPHRPNSEAVPFTGRWSGVLVGRGFKRSWMSCVPSGEGGYQAEAPLLPSTDGCHLGGGSTVSRLGTFSVRAEGPFGGGL